MLMNRRLVTARCLLYQRGPAEERGDGEPGFGLWVWLVQLATVLTNVTNVGQEEEETSHTHPMAAHDLSSVCLDRAGSPGRHTSWPAMAWLAIKISGNVGRSRLALARKPLPVQYSVQ
jgi:hypothetical protein